MNKIILRTKGAPIKIKPEQYAELTELYNDGISFQELADHFKVSIPTISKFVRIIFEGQQNA